MTSASLAVSRGGRHLALVRASAPRASAPTPPAWRRWAGATVVVLSLGTLSVATFVWSLLA